MMVVLKKVWQSIHRFRHELLVYCVVTCLHVYSFGGRLLESLESDMKQFLYRVNLVIVVSFLIYCSSLALLRDVVAFAAETVVLPFDKSQLAVEAETRQPKASVTSQHKAFKKKVAIKADGNRCPLMSKSQQRVVKLLYFFSRQKSH